MAIYKVKGKKGDRWYVDFYNGEQRIRKVLGSKKDAEDAEALLKADSLRGELRLIKKSDVSFKELTEKYLEFGETNGKRSLERDKYSIKALMDHFKYMKITQINPMMIESYKKKRLEEKKKSGTVNRELSALRHMFNLAKKWKIIRESPMSEVKLLKEEKFKMRILDKVEADLLIDAAAEYLKPIIITALSTGMRRGEILELRWSDIDFIRYNIHIREENSKSKKSRDVPMSSLLAETLKKQDMSSEFIFSHPLKKDKARINISWSFRVALRKSGIEKLRFHDLRHTAASWMVVDCGIDLVTVSEILGHSDIKTTMIYCHASQESKRRAVEGLEKIISSEKVVINRTQKREKKQSAPL